MGKNSSHFQVSHVALLILVVFEDMASKRRVSIQLFSFPWQRKSSPDTLMLVISTVAQQEAELIKDLSSSFTTAPPRGPQFLTSFSESPVQKSSVMSPADQFVSVARASMRMQKVKQKLDSVMVS